MSINISRRKLVIAGGAALVAPAVLVRSRKSEAQTSQLAASDRGVTTVSGTESGFASALDAQFPGLSADPVFQKLMPLAILITLQSGPGIRAYTVSWSVTTSAGPYQTALFYYVSPGPSAKGKSPNTLRSAQVNILRSGVSRLVTPFFNWTSNYYLANRPPNWDTILKPSEPGTFLVSELINATSVTTSLDAVVFSDWKLLGPDKYLLGDRLRARRNAEHDEAVGVCKLLKAGAPDSAIVEALQSHASAERSSNKSTHIRWYEQNRRYQAQVLLKAFGDADRDTFTKAVTRLRLQKRSLIKRLDD